MVDNSSYKHEGNSTNTSFARKTNVLCRSNIFILFFMRSRIFIVNFD